MIRSKKLFIFLGIFLSTLLYSQVLQIVEQDQSGHKFINKKIADINSQLEISIDKTKLKELLTKNNMEVFPKDLSNNISMINEALKDRKNSLDKVEKAIELFNQGDFDDYVKLLEEAANGPAVLLFIPEIKQAVFEIQTRNQNYANPLKDVYEAAESVLKTFTDKLNRRAEENGVYLQLGSWLITKNEQRQIHLEGFDNIPGQTEYVVPRWQFVPTESESNNFYQFKSLAAENSARYPILILEMTREQFVLLENRLRLEMRDISDRLTPITNNIRNINADTSNIQGALNTLRTLISDYTNFVLGITAKYKNIPAQSNVGPANLIASANEDFAAIERETLTLKEKIGSQIALVERELQLLPGGVGQGNIIIIGPLGLIGPRIELQIVSWIFQAKNRLDELLKGRKFDMAALELSEAVTKMDINNIPEKTVISLKKTGIRENGDVLAIKMIVGGAKTKGAQVTETHEVTLFMVLPHIKTVAGLIFAHSTAKADQDTKFHMSPSYNFLFKGILDQKLRRKSILYNRIFEFSFGLNLASLDLNNDYVQELGIALVISAFADLAQIGYGYNITEKKPYWFFGIRLPLFPVIYF